MSESEEEDECMDEEQFISIKNEFYKFREQLSKNIKKTFISSKEGCYLIEDSCIKELEEGFNDYELLKRENKIDEKFDYDDFIPEDFTFINDFSSVINCLKSKKKFKLISKQLLEEIYDEDFLKEKNCIKYYSGKNKLLIEFKDKVENKSILIIDPLNENEIEKRIYIITNKPEKNGISLNKLLNEKDKFNNESEEKYNNMTIIPYEIYYNILKFFVYYFYYEKDLSNDKKEIFKDNEDYYLINNEWLIKFKKYYDYKSSHIKILGKDLKAKYNNLEQNFNDNISINKNIIDYNEINLFDEIINMAIKPKRKILHNIYYFLNSYIITSKMMDIIKSIFKNKEIDVPTQKIKFINNYIYLIYPKKIIVGTLDKNNIFNSKYLFAYNSTEIFESEKEDLFKTSIEEYLNEFDCKLNNYELQSLTYEDNEKVGKFINIKNDKIIENQSNKNIIGTENKNNEQPKPKNNSPNKSNEKGKQEEVKESKKDNSEKNDIINSNEKQNLLKVNSIQKEKNDNSKNEIEKSNKDKKNINEHLDKNKEELNEKNEKLLNSENDYKKLKTEFSNIENKLKEKEIELKNQLDINELNNKKLEEKEKEIKEFNEKIKQFSIDNNNKEENINKLNKDIEEKDKLINNLENSKKELEEKSKKVNEEIKKLKEKKENKKEKQNNKVNELMKENQKLKEENKDKLDKLTNLYNGLKKDNDELKKKEIEYQQKIQENEKKLKDMDNKEETIKKLTEEIELEKEKNNKNNEIKQKNKNEKNNLNRKIKELEENETKCKQELENKNQEIEELKKSNDEILKKKNEEMDDLKTKYEENNSNLVKEINKLKDEVEQLKQNNSKISSDLEEKIKNNEQLKKESEDFENKKNEIKTKVNEYKKKVSQKLEDKEETIKKLNKEIELEKENNTKINEQNKILIKDKKDLNAKIEELNKEVKLKNDLNEEKEKLIKEKEDLEEKLNQDIKELKKTNKMNENKIKEYEERLKESNQKEEEDNKIIKELEEKNKNNEQLEKENKSLKEKEIKLEEKISEFSKIIEEKNKEIYDLSEFKNQVEESEKNIILLDEIEKKENEIEMKKIEFEKDKEENERIQKENERIQKENEMLIKKKEEIEKQIKEKKPLLNYIEIKTLKEPILIGLNNIGATCFMNSTLQCLSQTKALSDFFLNPKNENLIQNNNIAINNKNENKNDLQLSPVFSDLIKQLWNIEGSKPFSPNNFRIRVEQMNPLFRQGQPGDSKDFIIFILEQLHKELKRPNKNIIKAPSSKLNQYNKNSSFEHFYYDFQSELSIISDVFYGFNETSNECLNCKNLYNCQGNFNNPICYNYGIFNVIIFPLEEVKNMKNNFMQNNYIQNNYMQNNYPQNNLMNNSFDCIQNNLMQNGYMPNYCMQNSGNFNTYNSNVQNIENNNVTLIDCFCYNQKVDKFTGDNRNYCNICRQLYDSFYCSKIFSSPNVLILILNRGKGNIFHVNLEFTETIDISQFVLQKDKPQIIYKLYGVITHIGESGPNAHFVASCKSYIDNKWYRFNDAFVSPINDFQKEILYFGIPYILFYQRC